MKLIKTAIVGCGQVGSDYDRGIADDNIYSHAKAYQLNRHVKLVAACDISAEQRSKFANKWGVSIELFVSLDELIHKHPDLDLISICTPTKVHYSNLKRLLETDIPYVLCEKPLVEDMISLYEIIKLYMSREKTLIVNHILRWEPGVLSIKDKISSQPSSSPLGVQVVYAKGLQHNGIHVIDLSLYLFGAPRSMYKLYEFEEIPDDPTCDFVFSYPEFNVYFTGLREKNYSVFEYRIYTEVERIEITELTNRINVCHVQDHPFLAGYRYLSPQAETLPCFQTQNMASVINDIVDGIYMHNPALFRCTMENARITMEHVQRIRELPCLNC